MKGFGEKTKPRKKLNHELNTHKYQQIVNEGFKHHSVGNISEAKKFCAIINSFGNDCMPISNKEN